MSAKIIQNDFATKEVKYQERCLTKYQTEAQSIFHSKNRKILNDASSKHSKIYYQWRKEGEHVTTCFTSSLFKMVLYFKSCQ